MASSKPMDLLCGRMSNFEEFLAEENLVKDLDLIVTAINSIPLHERLCLKKELLSESELESFETHASNSLKSFKEEVLRVRLNKTDSTPSTVSSNPNERDLTVQVNSETQEEMIDKKLEDACDEVFLKYFYNPKENNLLIPTLKNNVNFDVLQDSEKGETIKEEPSNFDLEKFLLAISNGNYDHIAPRFQQLPSSGSSSSCESSNELNRVRTKHLSSQFNVSSENSKFTFLKKISDDSLKINNNETIKKEFFHAENWHISSDTDSDELFEKKKQTQPKRKSKASQKKGGETMEKPDKSSGDCSNQVKNFVHKNHPSKSIEHSKDQNFDSLTKISINNEKVNNDPSKEFTLKSSTSTCQNVRGRRNRKNKNKKRDIATQPPLSNKLDQYQSPEPEINSSAVWHRKEINEPINKSCVQPSALNDSSTSIPLASRIVETKDEPESRKAIPNTTGGCNKSQESTQSSDEDWESRAQKNLSVVEKLLSKP